MKYNDDDFIINDYYNNNKMRTISNLIDKK